MEYLDFYDEKHVYLGKELRSVVHEKGLWHNTVHCWLYDKAGNIYFQIRADEETFYTTASGHVKAGESIKEAFGREIKEEIGINIDYQNAQLVDIVVWQMNKQKKDGTVIKDRAFANVNVCEFSGNSNDFSFNDGEVIGVVKVNASETLEMFKNPNKKVRALIIKQVNNYNYEEERLVGVDEFLVTKGETAYDKYKDVLKKVISLTSI